MTAISRFLWTVAFVTALIALVPSLVAGYSPFAGVMTLIAALAGTAGIAADKIRGVL